MPRSIAKLFDPKRRRVEEEKPEDDDRLQAQKVKLTEPEDFAHTGNLTGMFLSHTHSKNVNC